MWLTKNFFIRQSKMNSFTAGVFLSLMGTSFLFFLAGHWVLALMELWLAYVTLKVVGV